ncbi:MAG TPA: thioredoxin domain-containing protein [Caulobacterales bacterium]|nr:thioredoxin domain-containing protein [Caulobacterales bacterium]
MTLARGFLLAVALCFGADLAFAQAPGAPKAEMLAPVSPAIDAARFVLGPAIARVTVVIYGDLACPDTRRAWGYLRSDAARRADDVRIEFKHVVPHRNADIGARYLDAVLLVDRTKAAAFIDAAFAGWPPGDAASNPDAIAAAMDLAASGAGLDLDAVHARIDVAATAARIAADTAEHHAFLFHGIPGVVIDGTRVWNERGGAGYSELIEAALAR